jgi:hypothetical protein
VPAIIAERATEGKIKPGALFADRNARRMELFHNCKLLRLPYNGSRQGG